MGSTLAQEQRGCGFKPRYKQIVGRTTIQNDSLLSLGSISSGRLKKLCEVDTWSSLSICLSVRGMSVTRELWIGEIAFGVLHKEILRKV